MIVNSPHTRALVLQDKRVWTVYYHLREPSSLSLGTRVKRGQLLAFTGETGASTGIHLHFETRRSRRWGTDFDPESILGHASPEPVKAEEKPRLTEDGSLGRQTWAAVQRMLKADGLYNGFINGVPGKSTIRGLQKYINKHSN